MSEADRLREEMETVAVGLDLVIRSGCDQAANLARLRDHLRAAAQRPEQISDLLNPGAAEALRKGLAGNARARQRSADFLNREDW